MKQKVIFTLGTGHCGSTLLDLTIGSNSNVFSLGELKSLKVFDNSDENEFFNRRLKNKIKYHYRFKKNRVVSYDFHNIPQSKLFENRLHLYSILMKESDKNILVDSSKQLQWIRRGISHLKSGEIEPKLIYVKRSHYAVINSYFRKQKAPASFSRIAQNIKKRIEHNNNYYNKVKVDKITIQYEEFCASPESELKKICDFISIDYNSNMLKYWEFDHFNIEGNSGTRSLMNKYRNQEIQFDEKRKDVDYYKNHNLSISLDERWRTELNDQQIKIIDNIFQE